MRIGDWKTHAFNEQGFFGGMSLLLLSIIVDGIPLEGGRTPYEAYTMMCSF